MSNFSEINTQRDTLILDPTRFSQDTRRWSVPVLTFAGVTPDELYIDGHAIASSHFTAKGIYLILDESITITPQTTASLIIKYSSRKISATFWGPIIIALIGMIGTVAQPLLHELGLLYANKMEVATRGWGYDTDEHKFKWRINVKNFTKSDRDKWVLYAVVRIEDNSVDVLRDKYDYFGGPFELNGVMEIEVKTDEQFTGRATKGGVLKVQGPVFLVRRHVTIRKPFSPSELSTKEVTFISAHGVESDMSP